LIAGFTLFPHLLKIPLSPARIPASRSSVHWPHSSRISS
jgi:hypothetical protein